jgi:hypothetical protein
VFADSWRSYVRLARTCFGRHDTVVGRGVDSVLFCVITLAALGILVYLVLIAGIVLNATKHLPPM